MKSIRHLIVSTLLTLTSLQTVLVGEDHKHPRLFIESTDWRQLQDKVSEKPYQTWLETLKAGVLKQVEDDPGSRSQYTWSYSAANAGFIYAVTGEQKWADLSWQQAEKLLHDEVFTLDPMSFGLTRAAILQGLSLAYDFAYGGWTGTQREEVNHAIHQLMLSVHTSMGFSANYSNASNWMGVRWGAVFLASRAVDPLPEEFEAGKRPVAKAIEWDSRERLRAHLDENFFANGWNGESLGYFAYNWSFIGPALLELSNALDMLPAEAIDLMAPKAVNSVHGVVTAAVRTRWNGSLAIKPDLSDDNPNLSPALILGIGLQLSPKDQHPYIRWSLDYFREQYPEANPRHWDIFALLAHEPGQVSVNPAEAGWLNYCDPEKGVVLCRDRFKDHEDILFTYSATPKRVRAHNGPDTNTLRLIGLGYPWIIGAGRTGQTAGQTNLFPSPGETLEQGDSRLLGTFIGYNFAGDGSGSGWAMGSGSCVGVSGHERFVRADYSPDTGAAGVFVVADRSENGQRFRINTPEFMQLEELEDGYQLTAPDGSSLRVHIAPAAGHDLKLSTRLIRYGGDTVRNNSGIQFDGKRYDHNLAIDTFCDRNITVVMTLQPTGRQHPLVHWDLAGNQVRVGNRMLKLEP